MSAEPPLDVAISVANTDSRDMLRRCLESVSAACDGLRWHLTVVDNASTDGSAEVVMQEFPWVDLQRNSARLGFSANHNQVLRRALEREVRFILILNEDTVLAPGSIRELVRKSDENPSVGAAGPVIMGSDGEVQRSFFPFPTLPSEVAASFRPGSQPNNPNAVGWLNGSCVLVRTDAIREIGLLDERFFIFFEDTDLGLRLHQAGWTSAVVPSAQILHYGHQVVSQPIYGNRMERQMVRSRYLYFRKHHGSGRAEALRLLIRCSFVLRAAKAGAAAVVLRDSGERRLATVLWQLAIYDPRVTLSHELVAASIGAGVYE